MIIKREQYIEALLNKRWNGKVKIITGIRRCGKSFLLSTLYKDYLKSEGVSEDCFIEIALDRKAYLKYRNPNELYDIVCTWNACSVFLKNGFGLTNSHVSFCKTHHFTLQNAPFWNAKRCVLECKTHRFRNRPKLLWNLMSLQYSPIKHVICL